ncbi:FimV/HubP family polar landmark protein [Microbulbifer guangxiensis]|uniref:FimV/HubP family polar landmark protein n=1 Tax=Microbulbifer guangxiensis TaxID=2904249 RepID=UPI001F310B9E|nr:FimV/HubP family polar landmark protein [Microbulbifer guangxiensis]
MRVRKLALAVGLVSALGGNAALALGLGEVKLNSALNQPLNAEISLLQTRGLGEGEIKVRLASPEDFERAGVDRSYLLTELSFDVDYSGREPVIRISSRAPIREPFLNFLVETRWPSGRLLREYTLLMDLPAFSDTAPSQPVRAAERERQQVQRQAPAPRPQPVAPVQPEPVPQSEPALEEEPTQPEPRPEPVAEEPVELRSEPATPAAEQSQVYGPVSANETLWEIALENRAGGEFSVHQTMLAIQRLNPEAFINDNINLLKRGAVLRLPNADQVRQLTLSEAVAEVATQNESWRQRTGAPEATGAPLDARAAAADSGVGESVEGRLSLAAPGDNESVQSGSGSGAGESDALAGELAVTEEELDKSRLENEELQERISELDEQIDTMERLVEVSNEELKAVQDASSQAEPSVDPLSVADEAESAEFSAAEDAVEPAGEGTSETAAAAEEPAEADSLADQRNRVVVQTQSEPTLLDRLMENIQLIGIGIGGLLIALAGFVSWRRRREEEEAMRRVEAEMAAERSLADAPSESGSEDGFAAARSAEMDDNFDLGELDDIGTDDPVSEAEIHLSLGQYGEAESKLIAGLENSPQNVDARLMLLEVYAHQQDAGKFDEHYRKLLEVSDGPAADRAARLRESIAGAGPFEAPSSMDFSSESLEAAQLDDISASFDSEFSAEEPSSKGDAGLLDDLAADYSSDNDYSLEGGAQGSDKFEDDFSLDLDTDFDLDSDFEGQEKAGNVASESESDDFNLDDLVSADLELESLELDSDSDANTKAEADSSEHAQEEDFGSLDLDLDLGTDPAANEKPVSAQQAGERDGGLDFDLDLTPVGDSEAGSSDATAAKSDEGYDSDALEDFSDLGGELDLDSVDLDDISGDLEPSQPSSQQQPGETREAVSEVSEQPAAASTSEEDFEDLGFDLEGDLDSELNLLDGSDEVGTKLELAQAYMDMGDRDGARDILNEVVEEGQGEHRDRAREMLERMA